MGKARARTKSAQVTLDAGALIAIDRGERRMIALIEQVLAQGGRFHVPAGVLGQVWRDGRSQAILARFVRGAEVKSFRWMRPFRARAGSSWPSPTRVT